MNGMKRGEEGWREWIWARVGLEKGEGWDGSSPVWSIGEPAGVEDEQFGIFAC